MLRWLIIGHRWLGIVTCLLFALWFLSGLVMMYVAFPALVAKERLALQERIDWGRVSITPDRVIHGLALGEFPRELRLEMMAGEPVYQLQPMGAPRVAPEAFLAKSQLSGMILPLGIGVKNHDRVRTTSRRSAGRHQGAGNSS